MPPFVVKLPDGTTEQRTAVELPVGFDCQIQSWDMPFKDTKTSDFVVGPVQTAHGADGYPLDQIRDRLNPFPQRSLSVWRLSAQWPDAHLKLVEDKANGPAVVQSPKHQIGGLHRQLVSASSHAKAWVEAFIGECPAFPNGANDD